MVFSVLAIVLFAGQIAQWWPHRFRTVVGTFPPLMEVKKWRSISLVVLA